MIQVMTKEEWRPVVGHEGLYEVSNYGRVKSLPRTVIRRNGSPLPVSGGIIRPYINTHGYYHYNLYRNKKTRKVGAHRLVAEAFLPNPKKYGYINHKDENPLNNFVDNLEWCTQSYNINYGTCIERMKATKRRTIICRSVEQYTRDGLFVKEHRCARDAAKEVGVSDDAIMYCCNTNSQKTLPGGFQWKFKGSDKMIRPYPVIVQLDIKGNKVATYNRIKDAEDATGISHVLIIKCIQGKAHTAKGYIWKKIIFEEERPDHHWSGDAAGRALQG